MLGVPKGGWGGSAQEDPQVAKDQKKKKISKNKLLLFSKKANLWNRNRSIKKGQNA